MSLSTSLHDPVVYAVPVFAAFMALEILSLRLLGDDAGHGAYEYRELGRT